MRILALVILGASGIAAAEPVDAILDSDEPPDAAGVALLRDYLAHGPDRADRVVIANAKIGEATWRLACPVTPIDGLCLSRVPLGKPPRGVVLRCGASVERHVVVARDARKAAEAAAAFRRAEVAFDDKQGNVGGDVARARIYYAGAKLRDADRSFEAYASTAVPANLDFDPHKPAIAKASHKQFDAWVQTRHQAGTAVGDAYRAILSLRDAQAAIAATARIGQIASSFAELLWLTDIPATARASRDGTDAYCDRMNELAEPLDASAVESFMLCLAKSTELGWFTESSKLCERELTARKPLQWPPIREQRASPGGAAPITDVAPPH